MLDNFACFLSASNIFLQGTNIQKISKAYLQIVKQFQPRSTAPVKLAAGVKSIWKASPRKSSTLYQLVLSADNICAQFGPKSGLTKRQSWSGSKLFDTDGIPEFLFEKVDLE